MSLAPISKLCVYKRKENGDIDRIVAKRDGSQAISTQKNLPIHTSDNLVDVFDLSWLRQSEKINYFGGSDVRIADLFSGCGGMTLGLLEGCRAAGRNARVVFNCELKSDFNTVYKTNFFPDLSLEDPIETHIDGGLGSKLTDSEKNLKNKIGRITIAAGGPPCQGHSDLNNYTRRSDPRNELFERMARFAEIVEPEHIIIENVLGVRHDKSGVFQRTNDFLQRCGYNVENLVLDAYTLGVPQRRRRAFIVASQTLKLHSGYFDQALKSLSPPGRSVKWACEDLLDFEGKTSFDTTSILSQESKKRVDWMFDNDAYDLPDKFRPSCHKNKDHTYKSVYGRLYWEKPSWTITTGFLVMGQGRFIHPLRRRVITPHEGARLQFFPDHFSFGQCKRVQYAKMIGNAVPPKMAFAISLELLR